MNYSELANDILKKIGGKENVSNLTHCVTRLRFELRDNSIPNVAELEALEGVMKVVDTGAQLQVVIGNKVKDVYAEVVNAMGGEVNLEENSTQDESKTETKTTKKGKLFDIFAAMISGIFAPTLGVMAGTGMLKGLLSVLLVTKVLSADTGTYKVLYAISDAVIYFFPIFLGASAAKYFKLNQYTGIAIGAIMLYPNIIEIASKNAPISFMGLPMTISNYSSTVFPVILAAWFASKLEKISDKYAPKSVNFFLVPLIVLVVMIPLTFFVVGPLMIGLGVVLSKVVSSVYSFSPILGGIALGGPWILIVIFGLHWAFIPLFINELVGTGSSAMLGLLTANQFAMAGAAIAVALKTRDLRMKELSWSTGGACLLGVSEPVIYGVLMPLKKPLVMAVIGGSIGGAIAGFCKSKLYGFGGAGILQIPLTLNPKGIDTGFYGSIISSIVALIIAFVLTYLFAIKKESK